MNKKYPSAISLEKQREERGYKGGGWGLAKEGKRQNPRNYALKIKRKKRYFLKCGFTYHESKYNRS